MDTALGENHIPFSHDIYQKSNLLRVRSKA